MKKNLDTISNLDYYLGKFDTAEMGEAKRAIGVTTHERVLARALKYAKKTKDKQLEEAVLENIPYEKNRLKSLKNKFKYAFISLVAPAYETENLEKGNQEQSKEHTNTNNHFKVLNKYFKISKEQNEGLLSKNILNKAKESIKDIEKFEKEGNYDCALDAIENIFPIVKDKKTLVTKIKKLKEKKHWKENIKNYNSAILKDHPNALNDYNIGGLIEHIVKIVGKYPFLKELVGKRFPVVKMKKDYKSVRKGTCWTSNVYKPLSMWEHPEWEFIDKKPVSQSISISEVENKKKCLKDLAEECPIHNSFSGVISYFVKDGVVEELIKPLPQENMTLSKTKAELERDYRDNRARFKIAVDLAKIKNPDYFLVCTYYQECEKPEPYEYTLKIVDTKGFDILKLIEG